MSVHMEVDFGEPVAWGRAVQELFRPLWRWARYSVQRYMQRHARTHCPRRTGKLARSLRAKSKPFPRPTWELWGLYYGLILEHGSRGWARARRRPMKPYVFMKEGRLVVTYRVGFTYGRSGRVKATHWISRFFERVMKPYIYSSFRRVMIRLARESEARAKMGGRA